MLEVRIPISPRPAFFNRVRLIAASVRRFYPDALVSVACHPPCDQPPPPYEVDHWLRVAPDEARRWAGTRSEYLATMMRRYEPPFYGTHILMLDADVFCAAKFDELFKIDALTGVQAHHAPYGVAGWIKLWTLYGLPTPRLNVEYSGFGPMFTDEVERFGPVYFNSGMVFGRREWFEALAAPYSDAIRFLHSTIMDSSYWFDQVGLALAIAKSAVPTQPLPLRWNFPNRVSFDRWAPSELAKVKFLHAMQTDVVDRERVFTSSDAVDRLCARADLDGSNEVLRQLIADVRGEVGL